MITIRPATISDCSFVSRIILEAETSGAEITSYEKMFGVDRSEIEAAFEKALPHSPAGHAITLKNFFIAEENGIPAGGLSAYVEGSNGDSSHLTTAFLMTAFPRKQVSEAFRLLRAHPEVSLPKTNSTLQIDCVATLPEFRGKGILKLLLNEALKKGMNEGASLAEIQVWKKNKGAIAAYEKLGFVPVREGNSNTEPGNGKIVLEKKIN